MTLTEQPAHVAEGSSKSNKKTVGWRVLGAALLASHLLAGVIGVEFGKGSRDKDVAAAEAEGRATTALALRIGQAGFTNVVEVHKDARGHMLATLSNNPRDPNACEITFLVSETPDGPQMYLPQRDVSGQIFGEVTATTGTGAQQAMADLCS